MDVERTQKTLLQHGYKYQYHLGKGSFSNVILCQSFKYSDQSFAIKKTAKGQITEHEIMIYLNHPNIIQLYDIFEDENDLYLVMEYCSNGTIMQKGRLSYEQFIHYSKQILKALAYCHSNGFAHRDIKPDNIFLDQNDNIKLGDFGMAKKFDEFGKTEERCGSMMFFAPEMLQYHEICPFKADIWALGVTFFFMATGKFPFQSQSREELKKLINLGQLDFDFYDIDPNIRYLISTMTTKNINLRLTAEELLQLSIFSKPKKHFVIKNKNIGKSFNLLCHTQTNILLNEHKSKIHHSDVLIKPISLISANHKFHTTSYLVPPKTFDN